MISRVSYLHYTPGIVPKRGTGGGAHLRGLAPVQPSCEERRSDGHTVSDLTGPGVEPRPPSPLAVCLSTEITGFCENTSSSVSMVVRALGKLSPVN